MPPYVMGLFVVQVLFGLYQLGVVVSGTTATRLPDPVVVFHPLLGLTATALWIVFLASGKHPGIAWASFAAVAVNICLGAVMGIRTVRLPDRPARRRVGAPPQPLAEKTIPGPVLVVHGVVAVMLLVGTLLVAIGIGR
jgi:hypothetical protein